MLDVGRNGRRVQGRAGVVHTDARHGMPHGMQKALKAKIAEHGGGWHHADTDRMAWRTADVEPEIHPARARARFLKLPLAKYTIV